MSNGWLHALYFAEPIQANEMTDGDRAAPSSAFGIACGCPCSRACCMPGTTTGRQRGALRHRPQHATFRRQEVLRHAGRWPLCSCPLASPGSPWLRTIVATRVRRVETKCSVTKNNPTCAGLKGCFWAAAARSPWHAQPALFMKRRQRGAGVQMKLLRLQPVLCSQMLSLFFFSLVDLIVRSPTRCLHMNSSL